MEKESALNSRLLNDEVCPELGQAGQATWEIEGAKAATAAPVRTMQLQLQLHVYSVCASPLQ